MSGARDRLRALRSAVRRFIVPVSGEELLALRRHLSNGAPLTLLVVACSIVLAGSMMIVAGQAWLLRELVLIGLSVAALAAWHWLAPEASLSSERTLLFAALVMLLAMCAEGWAMTGGLAADLAYAFAIPIALAAFAPLPPTYTLALGAVALLVCFVAAVGGWLSLPFWKVAQLMTIGTAVAALSNQMQRHLWLVLERSRTQMAALDRVAGLGRLTAGLAHEVKTPIAATMNSLESAVRLLEEMEQSIGHAGVNDDDRRELLRELHAAVSAASQTTARVGQIIRRVREHTHGMHQAVSSRFLVADRARAVEGLVAHLLQRSKGRLDLSGVSPDAEVHGDVGKFDQILLNLVVNAIEAGLSIGKPSSISIGTSRSPAGALIVSVTDDGPGFLPEAKARLFQPMYTTKPTGTGLGLAISRELAEGAFGGSLEMMPTASGARFELQCGHAAPAPSHDPARDGLNIP